MKFKTKREATEYWINAEFNHVDVDIVQKIDTDYSFRPLIDNDDEIIGYPMWSTLFQPRNSFDIEWFRDNAEEIFEKTGIIVYQQDDFDILIGIDGCGYNFYDEHWMPLYELRGLNWHNEN